MDILGIDIGGSSLKGAIVDMQTGSLKTAVHKIPTPKDRKPEGIVNAVSQMVSYFKHKGPVGCGFPTIVKKGICQHEGNLHPDWVEKDVDRLFESATGLEFSVINDADAAGLAEINFGAGKYLDGFVLMITIGTGLGSGAYLRGELIPNFELGQIPYKEFEKIEQWAASSIKTEEGLSYQEWGERFNTFLEYVEKILNPDTIIIGGGISNDWDKFKDHLKIGVPLIPAELRNDSGILGAALAAYLKYAR